MSDKREYVTDWSALIYSLRREGYGFTDLAKVLGIPKSTLIGYRDGTTPKHPDGETLLKFWMGVTRSERGAEPKMIRYVNGTVRR